MKKYLSILFIALIALGCKKSNVKPTATGLVGNWELRGTTGGFSPFVNWAPYNGTTFQFNADSTFVQYQAFQLVNQGVYSVVENKAGMTQMKVDILYLNHKVYNVMDLRTDTLIIGSGVSDGIVFMYVRQ